MWVNLAVTRVRQAKWTWVALTPVRFASWRQSATIYIQIDTYMYFQVFQIGLVKFTVASSRFVLLLTNTKGIQSDGGFEIASALLFCCYVVFPQLRSRISADDQHVKDTWEKLFTIQIAVVNSALCLNFYICVYLH